MFYIIEIQKMDDGAYAHIVQTAETQSEAESKYYGVLQYAAISTIPLHSAALLTDKGVALMNKYYDRSESATVIS